MHKEKARIATTVRLFLYAGIKIPRILRLKLYKTEIICYNYIYEHYAPRT